MLRHYKRGLSYGFCKVPAKPRQTMDFSQPLVPSVARSASEKGLPTRSGQAPTRHYNCRSFHPIRTNPRG